MSGILTMMYGQLVSRFRHYQAAIYDDTSTNPELESIISDDGFRALLKEIDCFSKSFDQQKQSGMQK